MLSFPDCHARIAEVHAYEDEQGAEEEIDGDAFGEDEPGKEHRGDGVEINGVGNHDGSQFLDDPIPRQVTDHGSYTTQEQQVGQNIEAQHQTERRHVRVDPKVGNHRQQTIEEHLSGDEHRVVVLAGRNHKQGIKRPAKAGPESKGID